MQDKPDLSQLAEPFDFVHVEEIKPERSFIGTAACFADMPGTVVLASGGGLDCARYNILAASPWMTFKAWKGSSIIDAGGGGINYQGNPLDALGPVINHYALRHPDLPEPVAAGFFGYLAYDLKDEIEELPVTAVDDTRLPLVCMYAPRVVMLCDLYENRTMLCIPVWKSTGKQGLERVRDWFFETAASKNYEGRDFKGRAGGFCSPFTRETYMEAVERIRRYIAAGHIYQVNLSQRFETGFSGSPYAMFAKLFSEAPASFFAYVNAGDHWIVSTSPERFMMRRGDLVETRPIKGTRPRGRDPETDRTMAEELKSSPKDDAELSMIVDLMRNDLGRVCRGGSVEVVEHKRLEAYRNVFHLVSVVRGRLAPQKDSIDLVRAAFPGGSITGCPRIRAMEIIDELEPCRRHVYTGSIGYISFHDTMDLSIAIRTALIFNNRMLFSVGGGVVFDSDPEAEYEETLHKGRSVMSVFEGKKGSPEKQSRIWVNGMLVPGPEATAPVSGPGFQYGCGFFETIRDDHDRPHLLDGHLARFEGSWREIFDSQPPDLSWKEVIRQTVEANCLEDGVCAVKLIASADSVRGREVDPRIIVTAAPYVHRLEQVGKPALDLAVYPHPRQTPLASHKSLNYLYYYLAGRQAREKGADEALILNPDKTVSETNTGNLLLVCGNTVIQPKSRHVLAGVMQGAVLKLLAEKGYETKQASVFLESLFEADTVIVTNSLMGPVGARSVDSREIACDTEWIAGLRSEVFSR
ncbi:MAG: aminodeoxychorismate synthase component I [Desulfosalsimonas sp.]